MHSRFNTFDSQSIVKHVLPLLLLLITNRHLMTPVIHILIHNHCDIQILFIQLYVCIYILSCINTLKIRRKNLFFIFVTVQQ